MKLSMYILGLLFLSLSAQAGSTVCSGNSIYYNSQSSDFGIKPPVGILAGSLLIVKDATILVNEKSYVGTGKFTISAYSVELIKENSKVIQHQGNQKLGSAITTTTAVLYRVNTVNASEKVEIGREDVVCKTSWRMAM